MAMASKVLRAAVDGPALFCVAPERPLGGCACERRAEYDAGKCDYQRVGDMVADLIHCHQKEKKPFQYWQKFTVGT